MKKVLSFLMVLIITLSVFSASASDFNSWLSEYVGDPQISTTKDFLSALNEYGINYTFMGALSDGEELVTVNNHDDSINLDYTLDFMFSRDGNSVTVIINDMFEFNPNMYSLAMDISTTIAYEYGQALFIPRESTNTVAFVYERDLRESTDVGLEVLALTIRICEIIAEEYGRFEPIMISNEPEIENTPTPTPKPTATPTPAPTVKPITNNDSSEETLDEELVELYRTPSGFMRFYNNIAIDVYIEGLFGGVITDLEGMKNAFHLVYSESDSARNGMPTYHTDMSFSLIFHCSDVHSHADKMELVGDFSGFEPYVAASIIQMITNTYAISVGETVKESEIASNNSISFVYGVKDSYENDLFSIKYWVDSFGNTHTIFERK